MTALTVVSNRLGGYVVLAATVTSVAADAAIAERFTLPSTFGDLLIYAVESEIGAFSGAYVAPAPAYDGSRFRLIDGALATIDFLGSARFVHYSTASARPMLTSWLDLQNTTVLRGNEELLISAPVLAGAGVTVTVVCRLRGLRLDAP